MTARLVELPILGILANSTRLLRLPASATLDTVHEREAGSVDVATQV